MNSYGGLRPRFLDLLSKGNLITVSAELFQASRHLSWVDFEIDRVGTVNGVSH